MNKYFIIYVLSDDVRSAQKRGRQELSRSSPDEAILVIWLITLIHLPVFAHQPPR